MNFLIIIVSVLAESLLFVQAPILTIVPLFSAAYLIYLAERSRALELFLLAITAGVIKDALVSAERLPLYLWGYMIMAAAIVLWRSVVFESYRYSFMSLQGTLSLLAAIVFSALSHLSENDMSAEQTLLVLGINFIIIITMARLFNWIGGRK